MDRDIRGSCPKNEDFVRAFLGQAGLDEKEVLVEHALSCQECGLKFDVLRQLGPALRSPLEALQKELATGAGAERWTQVGDAAAVKAGKKGWLASMALVFQRAPARFALVAILLLIVAGTGMILFLRSSGTGPVRGEAGQKFTLTEPLGKIRQPPVFFKWTGVKNADYHFRLIDDSLNTLVDIRLRDNNTFFLPASVRDQLKKKSIYIWSVDALDDKGEVLEEKSGYFFIK